MCEVPIMIVHFLEDYLVCTDYRHIPGGKVRMKLCLRINTRNVEKVKVFNLYLSLMNYRFGVKLKRCISRTWIPLERAKFVGVGYGMNSAVVSTGRVKREVRYRRNSAGVVSFVFADGVWAAI